MYLDLDFRVLCGAFWRAAILQDCKNIMNINEVQRSNGVTRRNLVVEGVGLEVYRDFCDLFSQMVIQGVPKRMIHYFNIFFLNF